MKHSTPDSMKFKKLQRRLGVSRKEVVGVLELLWIATQTNARRGDIGRYTNEEIAIECDWEGDPDHLIESLVESGWLDPCDRHRLVVHDWKGIKADYPPIPCKRSDLKTAAWKKARRKVIESQGVVCAYCHCDCSDDPTVDHVVPVSRGGKSRMENLVVACRSCNSKKGDR